MCEWACMYVCMHASSKTCRVIRNRRGLLASPKNRKKGKREEKRSLSLQNDQNLFFHTRQVLGECVSPWWMTNIRVRVCVCLCVCMYVCVVCVYVCVQVQVRVQVQVQEEEEQVQVQVQVREQEQQQEQEHKNQNKKWSDGTYEALTKHGTPATQTRQISWETHAHCSYQRGRAWQIVGGRRHLPQSSTAVWADRSARSHLPNLQYARARFVYSAWESGSFTIACASFVMMCAFLLLLFLICAWCSWRAALSCGVCGCFCYLKHVNKRSHGKLLCLHPASCKPHCYTLFRAHAHFLLVWTFSRHLGTRETWRA